MKRIVILFYFILFCKFSHWQGNTEFVCMNASTRRNLEDFSSSISVLFFQFFPCIDLFARNRKCGRRKNFFLTHKRICSSQTSIYSSCN